jgi:PAS domain S-box-containing protein
MPSKDFEDKRLEGRNKERDLNHLDSGHNSNRSDKKLLLGTVQFYEDILYSLSNSLIIVYNQHFKQIEVWGNSVVEDLYGIKINDFKAKLLSENFPSSISGDLKNQISQVFETGQRSYSKLNIDFPNGNFWLDVTSTPLVEQNGQTSAVVCYFRDITEKVRYEKELLSTKEKVRNLIELSPECLLTANLKGVISSVNYALSKITGYQEEELIGKKITRLPNLKSQEISRFQAIIDIVNNNEIPPFFEFEWTDKDGDLLWCEVRVSHITKNNKLSGFQVIFNEITDRKLIEKDLLKSKRAYKVIIENSHEAIFIVQDNHIKFCNSRFLELLDCSMDELMRTPFDNYVHPNDKRVAKKIISERCQGKQPRENDIFRIINESGIVKWITVNTTMIDWQDASATLAFATDVTDKKSTEEKEKKYLKNLEFLSDKVLEFIELKSDFNTYQFLGEKIAEIQKDALTLLISYDETSGTTHLQHIEGTEHLQKILIEIINNTPKQFNLRLNHNLIRNLSFGKLIKINDGIFEQGYNIFPKNTFSLIQKKLNIGGMYLIGLTWGNKVFGSAMIFLPENNQIESPEAIEMVVKLSSFALQRKLDEDTLRTSEERYKRIFNSYQDVYFKAEIDGSLSEVSPSVRKILGYAPKDIIGKTISDFFHDGQLIHRLGKILLREEFVSDQDIQLVRKDGKIIDTSLNARILKNNKGIPIGSEGVIRDISERKKAEADFHKSEEKFRMLANFTYDWEYWLAPDNSITYISPSCQRISGYSPKEFIKNPDLMLKIVHPDDLAMFQDYMQKQNKAGSDVIKFDFRIITKDKQIKWINHVGQRVHGDTGVYMGLRASNRDITDRMEAEQELRNSEERFRTLFYESPDAIFVEDFDGNILDVNPAACSLHMMTKEELIGKNIIDLVPNSNRDIVAAEFPKWISGEFINYRGISKTSDGICIPVEIHASKIIYSGREALILIVRDITLIKETEDKLREAVEKAEEADMLKSVFLANMSHEIRTPMNAIIGFSEILSDQDLTKKERNEFINYITQGSNTLMNLIEDIIDITKIEAGQIKINIADCPVNALMDELYATFLKMKTKNGKQKLELRLNKPIVEEGFSISTDPSRIRQILSNLIGNAMKFTDEGFIEIGFTITGDNKIIFYVKDTGIGIPKEKQHVIFERFGQVEDPSGKEKMGTGLGLSISKKLSGLLGGSLTFDSEPGRGSIFYLTLPVKKDFSIELAKEKQQVQLPADWSDKTFLIAEDSILNYTYLEALFQKTKVKILWAKDGQEAVDLCRENLEIDLVLMDIKMPVMDGLEAISEIKKFRKELPIIVQTAYAMPEDRERSLAAGGDEHLTKPINAEELFTTITKFLN